MEKGAVLKVIENIKTARVKSNYSQKDLAKGIKITQNAYSKIELGKSKISLERLFDICDILRIDPCTVIDVRAEENKKAPRRFIIKP